MGDLSLWMPVWTREKIEKLQFNGKYQLASCSPCLSCSTAAVRPSQYRVVRTLGRGSFGRVYQVTEEATGKYFAMKVIEKKTSRNSYVLYCVEERRILASINFPFIVQYESHFQTRSSVCLVMEYVEGSDLYNLLMSRKRFDADSVRFFLSQVLLCLEYLHQLDLVYRDLKLENIIIDMTGNVKIVDLGLTRLLRGGERCGSFCGTVQYLAPELIQGFQYDKAVDWWAFGVLAWELRSGLPPF